MSNLLYGLLSQILTGKAMKRHMAVPDCNGLESWRQLVWKHEPKYDSRCMGGLQHLVSGKWDDYAGDFYEQFELWLQGADKYNAEASSAIPDNIMRAVVLGNATQRVRDYLAPNLAALDTMDKLRDAIFNHKDLFKRP